MEVTGAFSVNLAALLVVVVIQLWFRLRESSEGLKILVDPADSIAECVSTTIWTYVHC